MLVLAFPQPVSSGFRWDLWLRDEQTHSQLLSKESGHQLSLDAVARAVERRGKSPKSSLCPERR